MLAGPGQGGPAGGQRRPLGAAEPLDVDLLGGCRQAALDQAGRPRGRRSLREGPFGPVELAQRERGLPQAEPAMPRKAASSGARVGQRRSAHAMAWSGAVSGTTGGHVGAGGDRATCGAAVVVGCGERGAAASIQAGPFQLDTVDQEPGLGQAQQRPGAHDRSGRAASQAASVWWMLMVANIEGVSASIQVAASSAASPASAWPIASGSSPSRPNQALARRWRAAAAWAALPRQAGAQGVGEQVVVAVPHPLVVQRHQEQVGPLQLLQDPGHLAAGRAAVRQSASGASRASHWGGAQPVQHAGGQQEASGRGRLAVQHLGQQVVGHQPVPTMKAAERRRVAGRAAPARPAQPGRSALGALDQRRHLGLGQAQPHARAQEGGRLLDALKPRSAARTSRSWPRARSRGRGSGGSSRLAITRCRVGGRCSSRKATASCTAGARTRW